MPTLDFDWTSIKSTMLGARIHAPKQAVAYRQIPTTTEVGSLLEEVLHATKVHFEELKGARKQVRRFELSELYSAKEAVYAPRDAAVFGDAVTLFDAATASMPVEGNLPEAVKHMGLYFGVFHDDKGEKIVACKQVRAFKASLKKSHWMMFWNAGKLQPVDDAIFTLDTTFDYLITKEGVLILSPTQFVQTSVGSAALRQAMASIAPSLKQRCSFVAFDRFVRIAKRSVEAAKLIASIKDKPHLEELTAAVLVKDLKKLKVGYEKNDNGEVAPKQGQELPFLHYLDDRLFSPEWQKGNPRHLVAKARLPREDAEEAESVNQDDFWT
ncbi:MAG: DUF4868 domain-containing protein [Verrucomicrobiaceae bacterium]